LSLIRPLKPHSGASIQASKDPAAPIYKKSNLAQEQPKGFAANQLFERLINLSSAPSIFERLVKQGSDPVAQEIVSLFEAPEYAERFSKVIEKGLSHPSSPIGKQNFNHCIKHLKALAPQNPELSRHLGHSLMNVLSKQFLEQLHPESPHKDPYLTFIKLYGDGKNLSESDWETLKIEMAQQRPSFNFSAHRDVFEKSFQALDQLQSINH
jgi:hypothetical protein